MQFSATALFVLLVSSTAVEAKKPKSYVGSIDVVRDPADANQVRRRLFTGGPDVVHSTNDGPIVGTVFEDLNMNSVFDADEPGVAGVMVSDGLNVVLTDANGEYELPAPSADDEMAGFAIFITEPDGYDVPLSEDNIPQFYYNHKPMGSPMSLHGRPFRFGGLPPTGGLPLEINFPLVTSEPLTTFKFIVSGDPQAYSNNEIGYLRDSLIKEVAAMDDLGGILIEGDVMGDELSLYPRLRSVVSLANAPQYYSAGNHDFDFDSPDNVHSFDTFNREFGPDYYSFDMGQVHFVVMNDVFYPCTPDQNEDGLHGWCDTPGRYDYNGIVTDRQLEWLKNDLAMVPTDKLIFLHMHIPIVSFVDQLLPKHNVDNVQDLYETLGCVAGTCERTIVSNHAHTHTNDNMLPGEFFEGFGSVFDNGNMTVWESSGPVPFHQIIVGAASGNWYSGDFDESTVPESFQRLGSPKGYWIFEFDGASYVETFKVPGKPLARQMHMDIQTPEFVSWYETLAEWTNSGPDPDDIPPLSINDLPDTKIVLLGSESHLTVNVYAGTRDHVVEASFDGGSPITMVRTQAGEGEGMLVTLDPFVLKRQMAVARHAFVSTSGNERNAGWEQFRGATRRGTPKPQDSWTWTDQSMHIWQVPIPTEDLGVGAHSVTVSVTDNHGRVWTDTLAFEIAEERPQGLFQTEFFPVTP